MAVSLCPVDLAAVCTGHSQSRCQLDNGSDSCISLGQYRFVPDTSVAVFQVAVFQVPVFQVSVFQVPVFQVPGSRFQVSVCQCVTLVDVRQPRRESTPRQRRHAGRQHCRCRHTRDPTRSSVGAIEGTGNRERGAHI